jgi:hypothetical protein
MSQEPDDYVNDPIDDELDEAMMVAAELVVRAKRIGMAKLELPVEHESTVWTVTVKRTGIGEHEEPGADGHGANGGRRDGKMS